MSAGGRVSIDAIVSDFGGVLTSPLADSFVGVLDSSGVSLEELGKAMMALAEREGSNPLFELETGRVSEATFMGRALRPAVRAAGEPRSSSTGSASATSATCSPTSA